MAEVSTRKQSEDLTKRLNEKQMEDKMIQDIMDNFDFQRCSIVMKKLKWSWGFNGNSPSIEEMKVSAEQRLRNAMKAAKEGDNSHSTYYSSSGGFKGNAWRNKYRQIEGISLEFILTEWDSDGDY